MDNAKDPCVAFLASLVIELPCQTPFVLFIFLLVCFWRLSILLPPMWVILVVCCTSCVCYFATLCVPSLTSSQCTVAVISNDFTVTSLILTDGVIYRQVCSRSAISTKKKSCANSSHARRVNLTMLARKSSQNEPKN